jgi:DNA-binding transcriptional MocR family regulator
VAGVPAFSACAGLSGRAGFAGPARWVTLRSVSKSLGPDLRLAVVAGDEATITRVAGRQALGTGWVSYQLQEMVAELWSDASVGRTLAVAAQVYADRGAALRSALAAHGITASGRSGFTCWVPVADEDGVVAALAQGDAPAGPPGGSTPPNPPGRPRREGMAAAGWAVAPGQRFRIASPPGVRISFARLEEADAASFAAEFARALRHRASRLD